MSVGRSRARPSWARSPSIAPAPPGNRPTLPYTIRVRRSLQTYLDAGCAGGTAIIRADVAVSGIDIHPPARLNNRWS
mgnify:CR=1 FL=1